MKVYVVTYIRSTEKEVYDQVSVFLDLEQAAKKYEFFRTAVLEMARGDDPDSDEEVFRDFEIRESRYRFRCHVPQDKENFVVWLDKMEAK